MRIAALTLNGSGGWPDLEVNPVMLGLNVVYGPAGSGKTTVAEFLSHVLYGRPPLRAPLGQAGVVPEGEALVAWGDVKYRLRRHQGGAAGGRLTVSALDSSAVDRDTVRRMLGGLSPLVLRPLCAIGFRQPPDLRWLLSAEFAREFGVLGVTSPRETNRRTEELLARRDTLAKELETRLAGEGRASRELDSRRRELDRLIGDAERENAATNQRFRSVEAALTETDARLRYRRLEMNADRTWWGAAPTDWESQVAELDAQIARWRTTLAELAAREATVRGRLAQVQPSVGAASATVVDEQAWLAVARQLAADLSGEVARLARASASNECVCRDAHPRLRPIVETFQRQLDGLAALVNEREQSLAAAELEAEAGHLSRSQAELGRQLEYLLERRQIVARGSQPARRIVRGPAASQIAAEQTGESSDHGNWITAADAEQLEGRRLELEQQRYDLSQRLAAQDRHLRDLRAQRATVDRQRAALLSARSIEHVQRELALVEQKLQNLPSEGLELMPALAVENSPRASDILAKLTDGRLNRLQLVDHGRGVRVSTRDGAIIEYGALSTAERDQVYLSFSLALLGAVARRGVVLPLLLDEPFLRLDAQGTAALAAVLDDLGRHGQQIVVFTGQREAAERLASLGAPVNDIHALRQREREHVTGNVPTTPLPKAIRPVVKKEKTLRRKSENGKRVKVRRDSTSADATTSNDQSDAA